jgi:hypothetical protein
MRHLVVALLTGLVLVMTVSNQIYDTNYSALWEATALLAGDHPYRDFYEWGAPLTGALSALAQVAVGNRLIGEFGLQWLCIIIGAVLSFDLGLRLSRSMVASVVTFLLSLVILVATPTYNYPKLLIYPLALWLALRYLDRPGAGRSAVLGLATTVAFVFRHDHGVHVGFAAFLALVLARLARRSTRSVRSLVTEMGSCGVTAVAALVPWLIVVQAGEGLPEYLRQRAALYQNWSGKDSPFRSLLTLNPVEALGGLDWNRPQLPTEADALLWLQQVTLLVPILLMVSVAVSMQRSRRRKEVFSTETWCTLLAALVLALVDEQLLRQPSYFVTVAPVTAAIAAQLLVWRRAPQQEGSLLRRFAWPGVAGRGLLNALGAGIVLVTSVASVAFSQILVQPIELVWAVRPAFTRLLASPPIEGVLPADEVTRYTRDAWDRGDGDKEALMLRYLHDCTAPGDRLLVTGSTPSEVNYLVGRPFAGGHILWHHRWRSDPVHEAQSLSVIEQQRVPFAFSDTDPVVDDFKHYPSIHKYLLEHYVELEGSNGLLLVDTRLTPVRAFGALGFPCFR